MPEGDTVYRLARRLEAALDGRTLERGELRVPRHATENLRGYRVLGHDTHGKHLLTRLSGGLTLHTHLKMTGSWTVTRAGKRLPSRLLPDVRVLLACTDGTSAYGISLPVVDLLRTVDERDVVGHLGPDPLRADWDAGAAVQRLGADPQRAVSDALLDQRLIAGLGNLWANELCFLRGLHPTRPVGDVDMPALVTLAARALRASATKPGAMQITTGDRRRGEQHWVTGRAGRPCLRCGTVVRVLDDDRAASGRRTWWCPSCQPATDTSARTA
ncbi:DNA-formamidopyrimidine glycosylase family protein [uncultured Jatrophihabitans sp.]|uniref:DNA-formamidopyrimidine glycosylase family protein n=1 Tax=uncultured Jatrophihabitans sp. TaxID=1610747 RepID=UPI0035CC4D06